MLLMTTKIWARKYFAADCQPAEPTMRRWMQSGAVPGRKISGSWWVDEHAWLAGGDELMNRVLNGG
jgi:hypothetical protein